MHILTGLLLSRLLAGSKRGKPFRGFRDVIEIKHYIPGRVRFCIPALKNNSKAGESLKQLTKADPVKKVESHHVTGSLLIVFDHKKLEITTLTGVVAKLLGLEKEIEKIRPSILSREISGILKSADASIYESSGGVVDLKSLITLSFFTLGLYSLIRGPRALPTGMSLLYWAYNTSAKS